MPSHEASVINATRTMLHQLREDADILEAIWRGSANRIRIDEMIHLLQMAKLTVQERDDLGEAQQTSQKRVWATPPMDRRPAKARKATPPWKASGDICDDDSEVDMNEVLNTTESKLTNRLAELERRHERERRQTIETTLEELRAQVATGSAASSSHAGREFPPLLAMT